jgi:hypothetical protein
MQPLRFARLLPWLFLAVCPALLGHCGGATEGTETGNPPVIEQRKIQLIAHPQGVEIVGEAGAVSPGASVRATNQRTGQSVEGNARADGSLSLVVPGTLQDSYQIDVTSSGSALSATAVVQTQSDVSSNTDGEELDPPVASVSCETLENLLPDRISNSLAGADHGCARDSDCGYVSWNVGCYQDCGGSALAATAVEAGRAAATQASADVCAELESRCERRPPQPCIPGSTQVECRAGLCQPLNVDSLSCQELSDKVTERRAEVLNGADVSCTQDSDCTAIFVPLSACAPGCNFNLALEASIADLLPPRLQEVEQTFCPGFEARACPSPPRSPCPAAFADAGAACVAGRCEVTGPLP